MNNEYTKENGWIDVKHFEGLYKMKYVEESPNLLIVSLGNDKSRKAKMMRPFPQFKCVYYAINLTDNCRREHLWIHRMIASAYIDNPKNLPFINHKNGIKTDNRIENLEWITQKDNVQHAVDTGLLKVTKIDLGQLKVIMEMLDKGISQKDIGKQFNIHQCTISRYRNGLKRKTSLAKLGLLNHV